MLIKRLLSRKSGPKLPHDLVFVFKPSTADETVPTVEMSAEEVITSVNDERFSKVFDTDVNSENKRVQVLDVEPQQFINLLRLVMSCSSHLKSLLLSRLCLRLHFHLTKCVSLCLTVPN